MKKIIVIGSPGAGKSVFSQKLKFKFNYCQKSNKTI